VSANIFDSPRMFPLAKIQPLGCDSGHAALRMVQKSERSKFTGSLICCAVKVKGWQRNRYEATLWEQCTIRERDITHRFPEESHCQWRTRGLKNTTAHKSGDNARDDTPFILALSFRKLSTLISLSTECMFQPSCCTIGSTSSRNA
jgi:hypothetical protein